LKGIEESEVFVAAAPAVPVREVFRRFWLQCKQNDPLPVGGGNTAGDKETSAPSSELNKEEVLSLGRSGS
jgi:hypothetical protein